MWGGVPALISSTVDPSAMTATNLLLLFVSLGSVDRCDTELSLSPGGVYHHSSDVSAGSSRYLPTRTVTFALPSSLLLRRHGSSRVCRSAKEKAAAQQPITIFYNGQMCVCDVTEAQVGLRQSERPETAELTTERCRVACRRGRS